MKKESPESWSAANRFAIMVHGADYYEHGEQPQSRPQ
jgi:hypothetical protein